MSFYFADNWDNSELKSLAMENMDLQLNLAMMDDIEFEEKVVNDDLVFPSKPMELSEIEINVIKQEPLEEENQHSASESDPDLEKNFKLKMEENILRLCEELEYEMSEKSTMDFSERRSLKIRNFVERIAEYECIDHQTKIVFLKTRIEKITDEHKIAMFQNTKTVNSFVKMHEEALDNKVEELANDKEELEKVKVTNQELLQKI